MGGYDPYSNSKGCAELVCSAYRRSYFQQGTNLASGRAGNVVGGGDYAEDRLIPDLVKAARTRRETLIRNPGAVRPWQHVLEPLTGYLQLAEALAGPDGTQFAGGWNFGPNSGSERTVGEVADAVCRLWEKGARWTRDARPQPHEATFLKLDSSKARQILRWSPVWGFDETMSRTLEWYGAAEKGRDMHALSLGQIAQYLQALPSAINAR
jgi:CDP-glucose 4,6-dehydratase